MCIECMYMSYFVPIPPHIAEIGLVRIGRIAAIRGVVKPAWLCAKIDDGAVVAHVRGIHKVLYIYVCV